MKYTDNLSVNFGVSATFRCQVMGKHDDDRHNLVTV